MERSLNAHEGGATVFCREVKPALHIRAQKQIDSNETLAFAPLIVAVKIRLVDSPGPDPGDIAPSNHAEAPIIPTGRPVFMQNQGFPLFLNNPTDHDHFGIEVTERQADIPKMFL